MDRPILVTGGSGQIGGALTRLLTGRGIAVHSPRRAELNLQDADSIASVVQADDWHCVVNCAAYVAVDAAETDYEAALAVNRDGAGYVARLAAARDIPIIHLSTDYVFDGNNSAPYREDDPVAPINAYGRSKEAGEVAVRGGNPRHAIVRTAWVLSSGGKNFLDTMLRLGASRDRLSVVADQLGCPTSATDTALALLAIIENDQMTGQTLHFVNGGQASWFDLAQHIFAFVADRGGKVPHLEAIATSAFPTPAKRPSNSRLDTTAFTAATGMVPRHWRQAVDDILIERFNGDRAT